MGQPCHPTHCHCRAPAVTSVYSQHISSLTTLIFSGNRTCATETFVRELNSNGQGEVTWLQDRLEVRREAGQAVAGWRMAGWGGRGGLSPPTTRVRSLLLYPPLGSLSLTGGTGGGGRAGKATPCADGWRGRGGGPPPPLHLTPREGIGRKKRP